MRNSTTCVWEYQLNFCHTFGKGTADLQSLFLSEIKLLPTAWLLKFVILRLLFTSLGHEALMNWYHIFSFKSKSIFDFTSLLSYFPRLFNEPGCFNCMFNANHWGVSLPPAGHLSHRHLFHHHNLGSGPPLWFTAFPLILCTLGRCLPSSSFGGGLTFEMVLVS
uniref:Uncharacterized protein n=1 Tax=Echinococcus canadensis TaxID=519352 RepID=A0A915ETT1_9CEST